MKAKDRDRYTKEPRLKLDKSSTGIGPCLRHTGGQIIAKKIYSAKEVIMQLSYFAPSENSPCILYYSGIHKQTDSQHSAPTDQLGQDGYKTKCKRLTDAGSVC